MELYRVFWDEPKYRDETVLRQELEKLSPSDVKYDWFLVRFLSHARIRDTLEIFSLDIIKSKLEALRLDTRTREKWSIVIRGLDDASRE